MPTILGPDGRPLAANAESEEKPTSASRLSAKIAGIAGLLGAIVLFVQNGDKLRERVLPSPATEPDYQYVRLFGALSVPVVMYRKDFEARTQGKSTMGILKFSESRAAWDSSDLKNASFARGPVAEQLETAFTELLRTRRIAQAWDNPLLRIVARDEPHLSDHLSYVDRWSATDLNGDGTISEDEQENINRVVKRVEERFGKANPEIPLVMENEQLLDDAMEAVGFLYVLFENHGKVAINSLQLKCRYYRMSALNAAVFSSSNRLEPDSIGFEDTELDFDNLQPGERRMLLLSVYLKDKEGYPRVFCSSCLVPISMHWKSGKGESRRELRKPLLEKATKVQLPMGWYHQ